MIEQLAGRLWLAEEIVVQKMYRRSSAGRKDIQFADNLLRGLMAWTAAIEDRDIAKLAHVEGIRWRIAPNRESIG